MLLCSSEYVTREVVMVSRGGWDEVTRGLSP